MVTAMVLDGGVSLLLGAIVHALEDGDLDSYDFEWPTWLIHQCAVGRWENGYLTRDPRDERDVASRHATDGARAVDR